MQCCSVLCCAVLCTVAAGANNGDTACVLLQRGMGVIWATLPSFGFATFNVIFNALAVYGFIAVLSLATGSINGHPLTVNNVITMSSLLVTMATSLGTVRAAHDTQCLHVQSRHCIAHIHAFVMTVLVATAQLPAYLVKLAQVAGYTHRCGHMLDTLEELKYVVGACEHVHTPAHAATVLLCLPSKMYSSFAKTGNMREGVTVEVDKVNCRTPTGHVLFKDLSFSVPQGEDLM